MIVSCKKISDGAEALAPLQEALYLRGFTAV